MAINFETSKTRENLMRAFAGESQARNRYTIAAEAAREQNLFAINQVFLFTADQERAHAERFYDLLKSEAGTTIQIDGAYPVDHFESVTELLKAASHNEMEEFEDVYPAFAKVAEEEGFDEVAFTFSQIAKIEAVHGKRFGLLADILEKGLYFEDIKNREWMCLNCGHIYVGNVVPQMCPVCRYDRGYYIPAELAPYLEFDFMR